MTKRSASPTLTGGGILKNGFLLPLTNRQGHSDAGATALTGDEVQAIQSKGCVSEPVNDPAAG